MVNAEKFNIAESTERLTAWRNEVLDQVAHTLASPLQNEIQRLTDMWSRACDFNFPARSDMQILPNGCLVFDVDVAGHPVHFSVWMTFGEIRIGAKIPMVLIPNSIVSNKLSCAFNGLPCWRETTTGNNIVYDWTFTDGFASYDHMMKSVRDDMMASIISWRAGEILTHLYISILSFLVDGNGYTVTMHEIATPSVIVRYRFVVRGDIGAFNEFLIERDGKNLSQPKLMSDEACEIFAEMPQYASVLSVGEFRDQDGGEFSIVSVEAV